MQFYPSVTFVALTVGLFAGSAFAHDGRRFQIEVENGQLEARGVNTVAAGQQNAGVVIDPFGLRPYVNAQHGHWEDTDGLGNLQTPQDDLPGYDIGAGGDALIGADITWTLTGAVKWENVRQHLTDNPSSVPLGLALPQGVLDMPFFIEPTETTPDFEPLGAGEVISVLFDGQLVSTDAPGSITLIEDYDGNATLSSDGITQFDPSSPGSNGVDLDLSYFFGAGPAESPSDTLYVIQSVLSATDDGESIGIADSDPIYTIFSPDGTGPIERLHFASLYLEEFTAQFGIPEPGSLALVLGMSGLIFCRRQTSTRKS